MKNILFTNHIKQIKGVVKPPADKSISHRAIILATLAKGESTIENMLESEDVFRTLNVCKLLGTTVYKDTTNNNYTFNSLGFYGLNPNNKSVKKLYMGNSGTSCRLLSGVLASIGGEYFIKGDNSLSKRPMDRIITPLIKMGANIDSNNGGLPLTIHGRTLHGINHKQSVASAQVKSCILLASLFAKGSTEIFEPTLTRDHSENMLKQLGVNIQWVETPTGKEIYIFNNYKNLQPYNYKIPADFSSASFLIALALITPDSEITINNVNLNPLRCGLLKYLQIMEANINLTNMETIQGELVGTIIVKSSILKPVKVAAEDIPTMIDELPILFVIAAQTEGISTFYGIQELRYKESDRVHTMAKNLQKLGIKILENKDSLQIYGKNTIKEGGITINSAYDHRVAMAFLTMGSCCLKPLKVLHGNCIKTSFPNFLQVCEDIGYKINIADSNEI